MCLVVRSTENRKKKLNQKIDKQDSVSFAWLVEENREEKKTSGKLWVEPIKNFSVQSCIKTGGKIGQKCCGQAVNIYIYIYILVYENYIINLNNLYIIL